VSAVLLPNAWLIPALRFNVSPTNFAVMVTALIRALLKYVGPANSVSMAHASGIPVVVVVFEGSDATPRMACVIKTLAPNIRVHPVPRVSSPLPLMEKRSSVVTMPLVPTSNARRGRSATVAPAPTSRLLFPQIPTKAPFLVMMAASPSLWMLESPCRHLSTAVKLRMEASRYRL